MEQLDVFGFHILAGMWNVYSLPTGSFQPCGVCIVRSNMENTHDLQFNTETTYLKKRFENFPGIVNILNIPIEANNRLEHPLDKPIIDMIYSIGLLGWSAHTIYDRIRDEREGRSSVPIANQYINEMYNLRSRLQLDDEQEKIISNIMGKMEHANFMEEANIEDHGFIYRSTWKSMGAALPLILVIMKAGIDRSYVTKCLSYFYHFIAARQLSDDAVDWKEDMLGERHSLVSYLVLEEVLAGSEHTEFGSLDQIFRDKVTPIIAKRIIHHAKISMGIANKLVCFNETDFLEVLPRSYLNMAIGILRKYE